MSLRTIYWDQERSFLILHVKDIGPEMSDEMVRARHLIFYNPETQTITVAVGSKDCEREALELLRELEIPLADAGKRHTYNILPMPAKHWFLLKLKHGIDFSAS